MREILFRGKSKAQGSEWLYGDVLIYENLAQIWETINSRKHNSVVSLETVGQYTGLTDKNGKKIFEGDILSYTEEIETRSKGKETLKGIYEVKFEYCGFSPLDCLACNHLEIIGNIHDNPELMKGE
ncbi:MAG: hypothetical protein IKB47_00815 [Clostridia bacterium]|nr:hypothetical protein [Clostridia bacterium]